MGDSTAVTAVFDEVVATFGRIDVLVNSAGIGSVDAFADIPDETWARVINVNLNGAFYCARQAVRAVWSSTWPAQPPPGGDGPAHYCASKAVLMGLTRSMAKELAPKGIRVNTLVPGLTNRPMMQSIPQEWTDTIIQGVPMGHMAEPEDIARAALFWPATAAVLSPARTWRSTAAALFFNPYMLCGNGRRCMPRCAATEENIHDTSKNAGQGCLCDRRWYRYWSSNGHPPR